MKKEWVGRSWVRIPAPAKFLYIKYLLFSFVYIKIMHVWDVVSNEAPSAADGATGPGY